MKDRVKNLKFYHLRHYSETRMLLHKECTGGKLVMTNRTTPKGIQITIRTLAGA